MKTKEQILQGIKKIKDDSRMKGYGTDEYKPANVQINAPLALIQTNFEGFISALEWVLEDVD